MKRLLTWMAAFVGVAALGMLIWQGYDVPWTGLPEQPAEDGITPAKTLWDWLDLLIVPVALALAAYFLDLSKRTSDRRIETDRQQQATLDKYFQTIAQLLLNSDLRDPSSPGRSIARTQTLASLRSLDRSRKAQLLQFLYEADLINADPVVSLNGADLDGIDLFEATLEGAEVRGAYLRGADLRRSNLRGADLRGSGLTKADLRDADLANARLVLARLSGANFQSANTEGADFDQVEASGLRPKVLRMRLLR